MPSSNKNEAKLKGFVAYCKAHPEERFWQALRNWAKVDFVLTAKHEDSWKNIWNVKSIHDTFYDN